MNSTREHINIYNGHRAIFLVVLCFFVVCLFASKRTPLSSQKIKNTKTETDTKVYLDHADELSFSIDGPHPNAQFAKGNVEFRHKGAHLKCDSAYFYQMSNSFQALGHVRMKQGDTLTLTCERAYYDGNEEMAQARKNVVLTHRKTVLKCDSLNYSRRYNLAYYFDGNGGTLYDGENTLTSDWGQYSTAQHIAMFYYDVTLKNKKFNIKGDTLHYDTDTKRAHFLGETTIISSDNASTVISKDGFYNTDTQQAELFGRSTVKHKDGKVITADSLYHNDKDGTSVGFNNVVYTDVQNKNILNAGHFAYNENTGKGFATRDPVVKDYSQGDTLFVHSDTMRIETFNIDTDSVFRKIHAYSHVRAFRPDVQAVADSIVISSLDSCLTMYRDPVCWNDNRQLLGEKIEVYLNDSTIRYAHIKGQALSVELMNDNEHYNQIASDELKSWFEDGDVRLTQAEKNVQVLYYPVDDKDSTLIGMNYTETDTMRMFISPERKLERIWMTKHKGTLYPMTQIPAGKDKLPTFGWFDYMRPMSKEDIFIWRPKSAGAELKQQKRRQPPTQKLNSDM